MNRIRNSEPSAESQNPSTATACVDPDSRNSPLTIVSVNGLPDAGGLTRTVISTKSYAPTEAADCEKDTSCGAAISRKAAATNAAATRSYMFTSPPACLTYRKHHREPQASAPGPVANISSSGFGKP